MKYLARILIAFAIVSCVLLPAPSVSANPNRTDFTGTELCEDSTYNFVREWMSGPNNYHARGVSQTCYETASIPEMTGTLYLYDFRLNAFDNFSTYGLSGKFRLVSAEGGEWVGTTESPRSSSIVTVVGHGVGKYQGLELHWFLDHSVQPVVFSGYILDPGTGN